MRIMIKGGVWKNTEVSLIAAAMHQQCLSCSMLSNTLCFYCRRMRFSRQL
jgi:hypothetical protein